MLHDVIILLHFTLFPNKKHKNQRKYIILYFSPRKGTLTDVGDGDGGGKSYKFLKRKYENRVVLYICFPRKGTLTDAGMGGI